MRGELGDMHERMMRATSGLSPVEADAVTAFLERMRCAVAGPCTRTGEKCCLTAERDAHDAAGADAR